MTKIYDKVIRKYGFEHWFTVLVFKIGALLGDK
jgi:hypothetical protein